MKRLMFVAVLAVVLGFSTLANAALVNNGGGLIYDTDLNITWYDAADYPRNWSDSKTWAAGLTVGNTTAGTWRLPSTVDGPYVLGYDGTTTAGFNITTSEMGHLYYTELGNKGYYDVNGKWQSGYGLVNKGPFTKLLDTYYWSGTEHSLDTKFAWFFPFYGGDQTLYSKVNSGSALAVHPGNVGAPVPIPGAA
jgi:hypothetical protein